MSTVLIAGQLLRGSKLCAPKAQPSKLEGSKGRMVNERHQSTMYRRLLDTSLVWGERIKQRRELQELANSPELLMDIGLSRYDVLREGKKPFWQE